ncbi:MAG: B3/4 domain-containing protein [Betaproteobacteria bacterium]
MSALNFSIHPSVRALGVRGAFAVVEGVRNHVQPTGLPGLRAHLRQRLARELLPGFIETDPVLAGFRALHDAVGRANRRFPASAEALVSLYLRKGIIPEISPVVDIYNTVSLETRLSLGAHDLHEVRGNIDLRLTNGTECFVPLGATAPEPVPAGEYAYVDHDGEILCRLEHRQCERTRVTSTTRAVFCILQGHAGTDRAMIEAALARWVDLTTGLCGGRLTESWIIA